MSAPALSITTHTPLTLLTGGGTEVTARAITHGQAGYQMPLPTPSEPFGFDTTNPDNAFKAGSLARVPTMLADGYGIGRMFKEVFPSSHGVVAVFAVDRPAARVEKDGIPWYLVRFFDIGTADCDCFRSGMMNAPCAHIALILHYARAYPGMIAATHSGGHDVLTVREMGRIRSVVLGGRI